MLAGVTAVGCRRCGGGLAGMTFDDNVREALPLLDGRGAALAVIEGSGAVVPPVAWPTRRSAWPAPASRPTTSPAFSARTGCSSATRSS